MNNLYQCTLWDYTSANKDFYSRVTDSPETQDWTQIVGSLVRGAGISTTELSRHLDFSEVSALNRTLETTPTRDHVEALLIGKIKLPSKGRVNKIAEFAAKYVTPEKLKRLI